MLCLHFTLRFQGNVFYIYILNPNSKAKYYAFTITIPEAFILRLRLQGAISRIRSVVSQVRPEHGSNSAQQRDSSASAMPSSAEPQD